MDKVLFKKPGLVELNKRKYSVFDMHFHSVHSDGVSSVPEIIKKAKKLNINISITDHNEIKGSLLASKYKYIDVIPGIETTSKEGIHTLFYFYNKNDLKHFFEKYVKNNRSPNPSSFLKIDEKTLVDAAKDYSCLVISPHPYGVFWTGLVKQYHDQDMVNDVLKKLDGVEVINGGNLHKRNIKAVTLAKKLNVGITGGSDGHTLYELANTITYVKERLDTDDFLDAIKKKKTFVVGKEENLFRKAFFHSMKINMLKKMPGSYLSRYVDYLVKRKYF